MLREIKSWNGDILFSGEFKDIKEMVEAAIRTRANLTDANLAHANLTGAYLTDAYLTDAYLAHAYLTGANLAHANLTGAYLTDAYLAGANLTDANLTHANLAHANLTGAYLAHANLADANLTDAYLTGANLTDAKGLAKTMGVVAYNYYWKRFEVGLINNGYQFKVGINKLRKGEVFASDERITCSYPGFHFASRSWCAVNYPDRPLEALIKIPKEAQINEPWATGGKASADMIEIIQVFDVKTGKDVTKKYRGLPL
jgi:uncharacterized protein YjbI with pentapeptide repeats